MPVGASKRRFFATDERKMITCLGDQGANKVQKSAFIVAPVDGTPQVG